jgi:hypothetical protein
MGAEIPHWYDPNTGQKLPDGNKNALEINCSRMITWMNNFGPANGWFSCSEETARQMANQGKPTIALNSVHVVMVRPNRGDPSTEGTACVHVGGAPNMQYTTIAWAYYSSTWPNFYYHN